MMWVVFSFVSSIAMAQPTPPDFAAEQRRCQTIQQEQPATRDGTRCARRLKWLAARQDPDGSFTGLQALESLRRAQRALDPAQARSRAASLFTDPTIARQIQLEAGLWLVREALRRDAPEDALRTSETLWQAAQVGEGEAITQKEIADQHSRALLGVGDEAGARAVDEQANLIRSARPREGLPLLLVEQRRARLRAISQGLLGLFAVLMLPAAARGWARRPRPRPTGLIPLGLIVISFAALSVARDIESLSAFGLLFALLAGIHLLTLGSLRLQPPSVWRWLIGISAVIVSLAAGFLALDYGGQLDILRL